MQELISALASRTGKPQTEAKAFLEPITATVRDVLKKAIKSGNVSVVLIVLIVNVKHNIYNELMS